MLSRARLTLVVSAVVGVSAVTVADMPLPTGTHTQFVGFQTPEPKRADGEAPPVAEFPVKSNPDRPAGVAHSVLTERLPEQVACTAKGDVLAVVDTAQDDDTQPLIGGVQEPELKIWRFSPTAGSHAINKTMEKYRPIEALKLSPDGRFASVVGKTKSALVDVDSGQEILAAGPQDRLSPIAFSSNGRLAAFARKGAGVVHFDLTSAKTISVTAGLEGPRWVSDDGKLLLATKGANGPATIFDGTGHALYPKNKNDKPIAPGGAVTLSADGKRLAVLTTEGAPTRYSVLLFTMPAMTRAGEFPAGDAKGEPLAIHLSPDGRVLATQRRNEADDLRTSFFEVESGMPIAEPTRLKGGPLGACGAGARWLWHSWLLPQPKGAKSEGAVFRTDIVEPMATLLALPTGAAADPAALALHDATRAWAALAAMKKAGMTKAAAEKALAALPVTGLTEKDRAALPLLAKRLSDAKDRDRAVAETKELLSRITVAEFQQHVAEALRQAAASNDATVSRRAADLLDYWRDAMPARANPATIASRLALLTER